MPERTDHPTADEALRRARTDQPIRESLLWIATRLDARRPYHYMTPDGRTAIALTAATTAHPADDAAAEELERQLLLRMPTVAKGTTRGDYAETLRRAAGKGGA
ncbi:hypothetical protein ACGF1Z_31260 [Streptomyces sp. NPDC048018]|uniref:hypothetical protein n=1 Tax=Streptomyces sp. NPDC048018 TaxID=3365499 RepID=UPI00371FF071